MFLLITDDTLSSYCTEWGVLCTDSVSKFTPSVPPVSCIPWSQRSLSHKKCPVESSQLFSKNYNVDSTHTTWGGCFGWPNIEVHLSLLLWMIWSRAVWLETVLVRLWRCLTYGTHSHDQRSLMLLHSWQVLHLYCRRRQSIFHILYYWHISVT